MEIKPGAACDVHPSDAPVSTGGKTPQLRKADAKNEQRLPEIQFPNGLERPARTCVLAGHRGKQFLNFFANF